MNIIKKIIKKVYWSVNFQYKFTLNGVKLRGLKIYQAKTDNIDELWMGQILNILLKTNADAFLDVGVNLGQTLCQVKSFDFNRMYFGFEPNPACNMFVEELIRINKFPEVKIFPVGIFTDDSILELDLFYDDLTNSGGSVIKDHWAYSNIKAYRTIIVPLMTYDTIVRNTPMPKIGILKIDVEGAELEVLQALYKKIELDRPVILIEVLSAYSSENIVRIERQKEIINIINILNYYLFRIIEHKEIGITAIQKINIFDPKFDKNQANYLVVPCENVTIVSVLKEKYEFS